MNRWSHHQKSIKQHIEKEDIKNFLNWSTITATMFVGNGADYIDSEYKELIDSGWEKVIKEPRIGNPEIYNGHTSGNLIRQAYHIKKWQDNTGLLVKNMSCIVEVGGGYGAMRLIVDRLGFTGRYVIVDLPEVTNIQKYYTEQCRLETEFNVPCKPDLLISNFALSEVPLDERKMILGNYTPDHYLIAFQSVWDGVDNVNFFNFGDIIKAEPKGCYYLMR